MRLGVGSDMQRKLAEAMAGMLAAGGRAMTGTDSGNNNTPSRGSSSTVAGDGYSQLVDGGTSARWAFIFIFWGRGRG